MVLIFKIKHKTRRLTNSELMNSRLLCSIVMEAALSEALLNYSRIVLPSFNQ